MFDPFCFDSISIWFYDIKRCLVPLVIRKIQIKTTRYHFSPTSMATTKRERKRKEEGRKRGLEKRREGQKGKEGRKEGEKKH